jgi:hypothetical protein
MFLLAYKLHALQNQRKEGQNIDTVPFVKSFVFINQIRVVFDE